MDIPQLQKLLAPKDLDVYTVVVMARRELAKGNLNNAFCHLSVDGDKVRGMHPELYQAILDWDDQQRLKRLEALQAKAPPIEPEGI